MRKIMLILLLLMTGLTGCGKDAADSTIPQSAANETTAEAAGTEIETAEKTTAVGEEEETDDGKPVFTAEAQKFLAGKNETLSYRYFVPEDTKAELPLVLVLHGAGITGDDNEQQLLTSDNATHFVSEEMQSQYPCYVLAPQLPDRFVAEDESPTDEQSALGWTDPEVQEALLEVISTLSDQYAIDADRIYITGHSMGALGVWGFIAAYPDYFAAAAPISGLYDGDVSMLTELPIWVFHGQNDMLVPVEREETLVEQIRTAGSQNIRWTVYTDEELPDMGEMSAHIANIPTYKSDEFHQWLFAQSKK